MVPLFRAVVKFCSTNRLFTGSSLFEPEFPLVTENYTIFSPAVQSEFSSVILHSSTPDFIADTSQINRNDRWGKYRLVF